MLGQIDMRIETYSLLINSNPCDADAYNYLGRAYCEKGEFERAIEEFNTAIGLAPKLAFAYYNRGEAWLSLREWDKARADLTAAKSLGIDITAAFHNTYRNVSMFEKRNSFKVPEDIVAMLMQYPVNSFTTTQKVLTSDGKSRNTPAVSRLLEKFRSAGKALGEYLRGRSSRGITTGLNEAFVVDAATRDALIAAHRASAEILKPFLGVQGLKRWRVKPEGKWLIWTPRGTEINAYPAIKKHLGKYREALCKRTGRQEWYELQTAPQDVSRFEQPKGLYPNFSTETAFAFDDEGYYVGSPAYVLPTQALWLLGVLNTKAVSWFHARTTPQTRKDSFLTFSARAIAQIPIPDMDSAQKALLHKLVEYILYLKKQPTTDGSALTNARDYVMVAYFGHILDGLVYELYLPDELHGADKHFFQPLFEERLPKLEEMPGDDKVPAFREIFEQLFNKHHPVRKNHFFLDSLRPIRIIESKQR